MSGGSPLAAAIVLLCAGYGCQGGCGLAQVQPLPAPLPKDQTIEGGVQVRVSQTGFRKLENAIPDLVRGAFAQGVCVPKQRYGTLGSFSSIEICDGYDCPGAAQGCLAQVAIDSMGFAVPDGGPLTIDTVFEITSLPLKITWFGAASCTMNVATTAPARVVADVVFATEAQTGLLSVHLAPGGVRMANLPLRYDGCLVLAPIANLLQPLINSSVGQAIIQALSPQIDQILQGFLPRPLGLEGLVDTGAMVRAISPGTQAKLEARLTPGGYVDLRGGGLSLGVIAGLNSDADTATRNPGTNGAGTYHEHARCAPDLPLTLPDLPRQPQRGSFSLLPVPAFAGLPEPPGDLAFGLSRRFLQMAGFHAVNSGTLCLGLGAAQLGLPFNVGTVGIVIPSLAALADDGKAAMFIVLRPQLPVDFDVGTGARDGAGNVTDPALRVTIRELKADLYAFLDERYVRAFTLSIDLNIGVDLQFTTDAMGRPAVQPVLVGLSSQNLRISVENTALLAEGQDRLQMVFPMLAQLLVPVLSGQLGPVALPQVGGFTLGQLRLGRVDDGQERFLAVYGSLLRAPARVQPARLSTRARVAELSVPPPELIRDAVVLPDGPARSAGMARVTLELGADGAGPEDLLEWQWRIDGGLWRPYQRDARPELVPAEFLLQGRHSIEVRARPSGDYTREDLRPVRLELLVDSVPPRLRPYAQDDVLILNGTDLVTADQALRYQVRSAGRGEWLEVAGGRLARADAETLAAASGGWLEARASDEAGNRAELRIDVGAAFHGRETSGAGSGCALGGGRAGRGGHADWLALALGLGLLLLRRRRTTAVALALGASLLLGGCDNEIITTPCRSDSDCASLTCASGALPLCGDDRQCTCAMEIPLGRVGRFSSLAVAGGQALVSAYNDTYGDLMLGRIAPPGVIRDWQFLDGVPAGPVVLPHSMVRGGIRAGGDDVGRYTSIAAGASGQPMVAYHDVTHGALKLARADGTSWAVHTVDAGDPARDSLGFWAALSVRADGAPGIAYYADHLQSDGSHKTELRFAQATSAAPATAGDWTITAVASGTIPAPRPGASPASVDLPPGVGLFPAPGRLADGRVVIAYYDRKAGNLMLATASAPAGTSFALRILDGQNLTGMDTGDVGAYPALAIETGDVVHVTYEDGIHHNLLYVNTRDNKVEVVDDGYRVDGQNAQGLDQPVFHFVGDDGGLLLMGATRTVFYQDATSHELLVASRAPAGTWSHDSIAGHNPLDGAFGFFASAVQSGGNAVVSSYVINQQARPPEFFVQVFLRALGPP